MRKKKFTKGDWSVADVMRNDAMQVIGDDHIWWEHSARTVMVGMMQIASVHTNLPFPDPKGYTTAPTVEELDANAHLIAAAPELLVALEELLFLCELEPLEDSVTETKRAKAAIAKAYGEDSV